MIRGLRRARRGHAAGSIGIRARPPGLRARLRVRVRRWRLDRELAEGRGCDASVDRALRARQLVSPGTRRELARSLRRVVADVQSPRAVRFDSTVPVLAQAVAPWREALLGLADRLEEPGQISACGLARVLFLLTDGAGPLYSPHPERSLAKTIWWVADGMAMCSSHEWGCPVRVKLDPEHVAWTCGRCGAIATSDDPRVHPLGSGPYDLR